MQPAETNETPARHQARRASPRAGTLRVQVRPDGDAYVVALDGEIDVATAPQLRSAIHRLLQDGRKHIIVDLDAVTFLDAAAIDAIIAATLAAALSGSTLHVTHHPRFMMLLKLTCETHRVNVAASLGSPITRP